MAVFTRLVLFLASFFAVEAWSGEARRSRDMIAMTAIITLEIDGIGVELAAPTG